VDKDRRPIIATIQPGTAFGCADTLEFLCLAEFMVAG
jgi:hypothetical protein